jgi:rubrerythrin
MTSREILNIALSRERSSIEFYRGLADKYPEINELLLFLLAEEVKHQQLIEKRISQLK